MVKNRIFHGSPDIRQMASRLTYNQTGVLSVFFLKLYKSESFNTVQPPNKSPVLKSFVHVFN